MTVVTNDDRIDPTLGPAGTRDRWLTWRAFGVLMAGALVGVLALLPYQATLLDPIAARLGQPAGLLLAASAAQALAVTAVAAAVGLRLGPAVGLGAPVLRDWLAGDPAAPARLRASLPAAAGAGAASGLAVLGLDLGVFVPALPELAGAADAARPAWWQGLLAALYGGIVEEIGLRLGLMTALVRAGAALTRARPPPGWVYWAAAALAALAFGAAHLPATAALVPLSTVVVVRALVLNGSPGLLFGWLYWRRGLAAAMAAHLTADVVLHAAVGPLVGG